MKTLENKKIHSNLTKNRGYIMPLKKYNQKKINKLFIKNHGIKAFNSMELEKTGFILAFTDLKVNLQNFAEYVLFSALKEI